MSTGNNKIFKSNRGRIWIAQVDAVLNFYRSYIDFCINRNSMVRIVCTINLATLARQIFFIIEPQIYFNYNHIVLLQYILRKKTRMRKLKQFLLIIIKY